MNEYVAYPSKSYLVAVRDTNTKKLISSNDELLVLSTTAWIGHGFNFWPLLRMTSSSPVSQGNDVDYLNTFSRLGDALEVCNDATVLEQLDKKRQDREWELVVIGVGVFVDEIVDADRASITEYKISEILKSINDELTPEEIDVLVSRLQ